MENRTFLRLGLIFSNSWSASRTSLEGTHCMWTVSHVCISRRPCRQNRRACASSASPSTGAVDRLAPISVDHALTGAPAWSGCAPAASKVRRSMHALPLHHRAGCASVAGKSFYLIDFDSIITFDLLIYSSFIHRLVDLTAIHRVSDVT